MELFLAKSLTGWGLSKGKEQTSELRGGGYAARVQTGYEKDGSPKYRYFKTQEEYEAYLQGKGKKEKRRDKKDKKEDSKELESKTDKEHKESKKKQGELFTAKTKKDKRKVKKGFDLYLKVCNE